MEIKEEVDIDTPTYYMPPPLSSQGLLDVLKFSDIFNSLCSDNVIRDIAYRAGNYPIQELGSRLGLEDYEIANHIPTDETPYEQKCQLFLRWRKMLGNEATYGNFFLGMLKLKPVDMEFLSSVVKLMGVSIDYNVEHLKIEKDSCKEQEVPPVCVASKINDTALQYVNTVLDQEIANKESTNKIIKEITSENLRLRREINKLRQEMNHLKRRNHHLQSEISSKKGRYDGLGHKPASPDSPHSFISFCTSSPDTV